MKLLIQLVREVLHLSGKSRGISETSGCGNHACLRLMEALYALSKHIRNMPSVDIIVNALKCGDKSLFTLVHVSN